MSGKTTPIYDRPCGLLRVTRTMLARDKRTLPQLHEATGLPFYWLRKFRNGTITAPSINRVQFLHDKLLQTKC